MYLKYLDIENIRSIEKVHLQFSKGINLIVGPNNSGKSTIIKSIYSLQKGRSHLNETDIRKTANRGEIRFHLDNLKDFVEIFKKVSPIFNHRQGATLKLNVTKNPSNEPSLYLVNQDKMYVQIDNKIYISSRTGPNADGFLNFEKFGDTENHNHFIYPFFAQRKVVNFSPDNGLRGLQSIDEDLRNLPKKIFRLIDSNDPYNKEFTRLCQEILDFTPSQVYSERQDVESSTLGFSVNRREWIYAKSMGEGVVNILGLLSILLTEDNKLFLIEELENDIHPAALKKLLDVIIEKSTNNQFIISTHSNIVLKHLASQEEAKIFFTNSEIVQTSNGKLPTTTVKQLENTPEQRLWALEKLGYEPFDFDLYKSYLLFEESSAEQLVRDFLIPHFFPKLKSQIRTIAARGVNDVSSMFQSFLRLFIYIHTSPIYQNKAWVVVDGDEAGKKVTSDLKARFSTWPKEHFINLSESNIEEYYPDDFKNKFHTFKSIDKEAKRKAKAELTVELHKWIIDNIEAAKAEFEKSASEIIQILKNIETELEK